jgi:transcriptional regulator with XRE-family HTH domain
VIDMPQVSTLEVLSAGSRLCRANDDNSRIREIRFELGMQNRELAASMGVSPARISVLERDERRGAVTLKMMQKAAEALGYDFVYTLVPKSRQSPEHKEARQQPKPRIQLDSSQLGDTEQQRRLLQQAYVRGLAHSKLD